ncbi:LysR substrate-binding domain-containing protein [Pseudomonas oleovorans]|uniref:LysR substrate-binding domain-containing protein n=1 Tax=Ectopseudomonas oleovorans TaxID=301 RepID=UPI0030B961B0
MAAAAQPAPARPARLPSRRHTTATGDRTQPGAGQRASADVERAMRQFPGLKRLVADSDVLSMAPWDVIADEVESGQLALLPLLPQGLHQHSAYGLVSRAGHSLSPAAQAMVTAIRQVDEQTPRAGHAAD